MANLRTLLGFALAAWLGLATAASAQTDMFASRTITILVPFPPGGSSDVVTRAVAAKVAESLKASQQQSTDTSRQNNVAVKGPGAGKKSSNLIDSLLNVDASASGSDAFKGKGTTDASTSFNTQIADLTDPGNVVVQFQELRRVQLDAERDALRDAYERGAFSSEAVDVLRTNLDSEEIALNAVERPG